MRFAAITLLVFPNTCGVALLIGFHPLAHAGTTKRKPSVCHCSVSIELTDRLLRSATTTGLYSHVDTDMNNGNSQANGMSSMDGGSTSGAGGGACA